jgi:gliding motility-associated-like protein
MNHLIKNLALAILLIISIQTYSQITAPGAAGTQTTSFGDPVYFFSSSVGQTLTYEASDASASYTYEWIEYDSGDNSWTNILSSGSGSQTSLVITDEGGYGLKVTKSDSETDFYRCWIFEPAISNQSVEITAADCDNITLQTTFDTKTLTCYNPDSGIAEDIDYDIDYSWEATPATDNTIDSSPIVELDAPFEDTNYAITISDMAGQTSEVSIDYTAIAVEAAYSSEELKEDVATEIHTSTEGSAPIEIDFTDESLGNITSWSWYFTNSEVYKSDQNPFYVFTTIGSDTVYLTVTNVTCTDIVDDPLVVIISESLLEAPNAFTPNGDGINDEFRVVYRSIKEFRMIIFNRWGRKVYVSTDPEKGWDGSIGNGQAPPGVYFFTIEAEGYDEDEKHKLSGPVHLIRDK